MHEGGGRWVGSNKVVELKKKIQGRWHMQRRRCEISTSGQESLELSRKAACRLGATERKPGVETGTEGCCFLSSDSTAGRSHQRLPFPASPSSRFVSACPSRFLCLLCFSSHLSAYVRVFSACGFYPSSSSILNCMWVSF